MKTATAMFLGMLLVSTTAAHAADLAKGNQDLKKGDYAAALAEFQPLAIQGNAEAQFNLGVMFDEGLGVKKDHAQAASWYQKAAQQGSASAQFYLGTKYYEGDGIPRDYSQAASWFIKAAGQGNADAQAILGIMYLHGQGVAKDYTQAKEWLGKAADQKSISGLLGLGVMYNSGDGVPIDFVVAYALFQYAAALDPHNSTAVGDAQDMLPKLAPQQITDGNNLAGQMDQGVMKALQTYLTMKTMSQLP